MKVFQVNYRACGLEKVSIVVAFNKENAESLVRCKFEEEDNFELYYLSEMDLNHEKINFYRSYRKLLVLR